MDIKHPSQTGTEQAPPATQSPGMFSRINVWRSVRSHSLLFTLIVLSVLGLGAALLVRHRPYYEATSVIYVSPTFPATLASDREQERPYESYIEEQAHTITRYDVLAEALHRLKPGMWQQPGESDDSAIKRLEASLDAKREGMTYQVDITLGGFQPQHLAEVVNTVTNAFLDKTKSEEFYGRDDRLESLRQARAQVQTELNEKLGEQAALSENLGVAVIGDDSSDQLDAQVASLQASLTTARAQRIQAEANLAALDNGNSGAPNPALDAAADEIIATDPSLLALKGSLSQKRAALLDQLGGLTPNHPLRKATEDQLAQIEAGLKEMQGNLRRKAADNLRQKLRTDLKRAQAVESATLSSLQSYTHQATTAAPKFQRAEVLKTDIATLQARYAALDERTKNLELESQSPGSVHMFSPARTPTEPLPGKLKKLGPALPPVALVLALLVVVLIDIFDPRIYSAADIEQALGFSPIGMLLDDREVAMQVFDECVLRLAAAVDQAVRSSGVRTAVLTSVHPGAGTTSIVQNLGSTLAKLGLKTLTIDATGETDPVAYVTLSLNRSPLGDGGPQRAPRPPAPELKSVAVTARPFANKLVPLTSFMDQAFKDLTDEFDVILVDAVSLPISAETEYLARFADVTVLVAEAGRTTKPQLTRCARLLERLQVAGMATIINKVALDRAGKALREDLRAFEARKEKVSNLAWKPNWVEAPAPDDAEIDNREPAGSGKKTSTYA